MAKFEAGGATMDRLSVKPTPISPGITLQSPLSRRGKGPGILILTFSDSISCKPASTNKTIDPNPLQKWAEEGFAVVEIHVTVGLLSSTNTSETFEKLLQRGADALDSLPECESQNGYGMVVYDMQQEIPTAQFHVLSQVVHKRDDVRASVFYVSSGAAVVQSSENYRKLPALVHGTKEMNNYKPEHFETVFTYDQPLSPSFVLPGHEHYQPGAAGLAHTRTLTFFKKHLNGPHFDLDAIWDEHTLYEFGERDVEKTMATMVEEPYVNHVPTMTGGIGRAALTAFYRDHFIFNNPNDTELELISRTAGIDRVIDEFNFSFTHDKIIDWLVPGIPPTGRHVRVPFTSVVNIRGDRLYHEHISWDQASVLRQLGLLPEYLPFPYPLPDGRVPAEGKRFEYRVPAAGADTARKLLDQGSVESNHMFGFEIREVDI